MDGDRLVLVGHTFMTIILLALAIIALIEKSRITFLIWLGLLILFIASPLLLLKYAPPLKRRYELLKKKMQAEKKAKEKLVPKKVAIKKKESPNVFSKLKSLFTRKKSLKKEEKSEKIISIKPKNKIEIKQPEKKEEKEETMGPVKIEPLEEAAKKSEKASTTSRDVKTDFDRIIDYAEQKKEVSITDVAKHFNLSKEKVEEWAKILAEHDLLEIVYPTFGEARIKAKGGKK